VIEWQLNLQLPEKSVSITTNGVSSNPDHGEVYSIQHYVIKLVSDLRQVSGFLTNKTDRHDRTDILLKVAFTLTLNMYKKCTIWLELLLCMYA